MSFRIIKVKGCKMNTVRGLFGPITSSPVTFQKLETSEILNHLLNRSLPLPIDPHIKAWPTSILLPRIFIDWQNNQGTKESPPRMVKPVPVIIFHPGDFSWPSCWDSGIMQYAKISLFNCHRENYTLAEMSRVPEIWGEGEVFLDSDLVQSIRSLPTANLSSRVSK